MRRSAKPIQINLSRHKRLLFWAGLYLAWLAELIAGVFSRFRATRALDAPLKNVLDHISRVILCSLLTQAALSAPAPRAHVLWYGAPPKLTGFVRAMIGCTARRMLRPKTHAERIARLAAILRDPSRVIAYFAKRYARGFTRIYRHAITLTSALALPCAFIAPRFADSS